MFTFFFALAGPFLTFGLGKQLYTAAMRGYIVTGRSMNRKVYREQNPTLFRSNVIANLIVFPMVAAGSALYLADALDTLLR